MSDPSTSPDTQEGRLSQATVDGDVLIVRITAPEIRTPQDSQALRNELLGYVDGLEKTRVVIDLEMVRFIASAGLLGFLSLRRRIAQDPQGDVVLCRVSEDLRVLLQVCRLIPEQPGQPAAFQATATVQEAIAMVRGAWPDS
jgi:anti-anti-sigma factor